MITEIQFDASSNPAPDMKRSFTAVRIVSRASVLHELIANPG